MTGPMVAAAPTLDVDVDLALDDVRDLPALLHEIRATHPAAWVRSFGEPTLLLCSHALVEAALRDEETFPSAAFYGAVTTEVMGRNIQAMQGAEHRVNRALVSPAFRPRLMPGLVEPLLEPVAHEIVDRIEQRLARDGSADLVADLTRVYPFRIILRMLGLPPHAEAEVQRWAIGILDIQQHYEQALQCAQEFTAFVKPILDERRSDPGDDLLSTLATAEVEGERLSDDEIMAFLKLLFPAGADTTYLNLGSTLYALLTNPDQLDHVRADPATRCRLAAEEGLRWYPAVPLLPRRNPRDVVWQGVAIPADTPMIFSLLGANRDPAAFDDPDRYDVERRATNTLTFGQGVHFCLGAHLARAEMEVALRVLIDRLPGLRLVDDPEVRITGSFVQLLQGPNRLPVRLD
jgi:cytochrome P450